jgi:hypothetical protein
MARAGSVEQAGGDAGAEALEATRSGSFLTQSAIATRGRDGQDSG